MNFDFGTLGSNRVKEIVPIINYSQVSSVSGSGFAITHNSWVYTHENLLAYWCNWCRTHKILKERFTPGLLFPKPERQHYLGLTMV